jgi:NAD+ kinase
VSSLKTQTTFKHIFVMARHGIPGVIETLLALKEYLSQLDIEFHIEKNTATLIPQNNFQTADLHEIPKTCDLIVVIGGDGSLLQVSRIAVSHDLPVLGINRGRLGFLTDIHPEELHKINEVLQGQYQQELRFFLQTNLTYQEKELHQDLSLNDVVLHYGNPPHMIEFEIYIDQNFVCSQRADGLIIATPTGSTAYSLSGGGPILHPQLNAIVLVPMFPHTLSSRPIVVDADSSIEILISENNPTAPVVSCDGQEWVTLALGGRIHLQKYQKSLRLIHPIDYSYFTTLREKLAWEKHATR